MTQKDAEKINSILAFYAEQKQYQPKDCFKPEIEDTVSKVKRVCKEHVASGQNGVDIGDGLLSVVLLTDSHYTVNGTWEDTTDNIRKTVAALETSKNAVDGIVHLGDFTDGMTTKKVTSFYVERMMDDLCQNGLPVYVTLGNHDFNYFRGNKQRFIMEEQRELFGLTREYYYRDFVSKKIRCLFLSSYDADTPVRYGFSYAEVQWVKETLDTTLRINFIIMPAKQLL